MTYCEEVETGSFKVRHSNRSILQTLHWHQVSIATEYERNILESQISICEKHFLNSLNQCQLLLDMCYHFTLH